MAKLKVTTQQPQNILFLLNDWFNKLEQVLSIDYSEKLQPENQKYLLCYLLDHLSYNATLRISELNQIRYYTSPFMLTNKNSYARTDRHKLHALLLAIAKQYSDVREPEPLVLGDVLPVNSRSFFTQFYDFWDIATLTTAITKLPPARPPLHMNGLITALFEKLIKKRIWLNDFLQNPLNNQSNPLDQLINWLYSECRRLLKLKNNSYNSLANFKEAFIQKLKRSKLCIYYVSPLSDQVELLFSYDETHSYRELLAKSGFYLTKHEANIRISSLVLNKITSLSSSVTFLLKTWASLFYQNGDELSFYNAIIAIKKRVSKFDPKTKKYIRIKDAIPKIDPLLTNLEQLTVSGGVDGLLASAMFKITNYIVLHAQKHKLYVFILNCIGNELTLFLKKDPSFTDRVRSLQNIQELLYMTLKIIPDDQFNLSAYFNRIYSKHSQLSVTSYTMGFGMHGYFAVCGCLVRHFPPKVNIALFSHNYFEATALINSMKKLPGFQIFDEYDSLDQVDINNTDAIVIDFHPNNATAEIVYKHDISAWLSRTLDSLSKPLTIIIDVTINRLQDREIHETIQLLRSHPNGVWVNIVLLQSLTKFAQLGADILSGGALTVINSGDERWRDFNDSMAVDLVNRALSPTAQQFFCFHLEYLRELTSVYFDTINSNTNTLFRKSKAICDDLEININYQAMRLQVNADDATCYVAFDFKDFLSSRRRAITVKVIEQFIKQSSDYELDNFLRNISQPDLDRIMGRHVDKKDIRNFAEIRAYLLSLNNTEFGTFLSKANHQALNQCIDSAKDLMVHLRLNEVGRDILSQLLDDNEKLLHQLESCLEEQARDEYDSIDGRAYKYSFLFSMFDNEIQATIVKKHFSVDQKKWLLSMLYKQKGMEFRTLFSGILQVAYQRYFDKHAAHDLLTDIMDLLISPLIGLYRVPITFRMSIGFMLSVISECGTAIRFSVGIEPEDFLDKYSEIIAHVTFLLNRCDNYNQLLGSNYRTAYFNRAMALVAKYHHSVVNNASFTIGEELEVTAEVVVGEDSDGEPDYQSESLGTGKLVVDTETKGLEKKSKLRFVSYNVAGKRISAQHINIFQWNSARFSQLSLGEQIRFIWAASFDKMSIQSEYQGLQLYGYDNNNWHGTDRALIRQHHQQFTLKRYKNIYSLFCHNVLRSHKQYHVISDLTYSAEQMIMHDPFKADSPKIPVSKLKTSHKNALFSGLFYSNTIVQDPSVKFELHDNIVYVYRR